MEKKENPRVEWMCRCCGKKIQRLKSVGMPDPGRCPNKPTHASHTWFINRTFV